MMYMYIDIYIYMNNMNAFNAFEDISMIFRLFQKLFWKCAADGTQRLQQLHEPLLPERRRAAALRNFECQGRAHERGKREPDALFS